MSWHDFIFKYLVEELQFEIDVEANDHKHVQEIIEKSFSIKNENK